MNRADALALLEKWQVCMVEAEQQLSALDGVLGTHPEAPLPSAMWHLMGELTRQVAARIGCCDEWLEAWWLDHQFGERPMQAGIVGEPLRNIATLQQLAELIVNDIEKSDQECSI